MNATYKIHPAIGIARLGNSPDAFYLGPETAGALPTECDELGNPKFSPDGKTPVTVKKFKDAKGRIKRQAARFQVWVYDEEEQKGRPLKIGDPIEGGGNKGTLVAIQWRVHMANKKASWYQFEQLQGEHGYSPDHPLRNPDVTGAARSRLIIDPGARIVDSRDNRRASLDRSGDGVVTTTFPGPLTPLSIDKLGDLIVDDEARLLVLGGHGHSGTEKTGPGNPSIQNYANNDGWFDDTGDGPVMARLVMFSEEVQRLRFVDVEYPAWVLTGYPSYVPEILDIITMDEAMEDMFVREMAYDTEIYGRVDSFKDPDKIDSADPEALRFWRRDRLEWNPNYCPGFYADIWSILFRPNEFNYLTLILQASNYPHAQETRGTFNPADLSRPPSVRTNADANAIEAKVAKLTEHLGHYAEYLVKGPSAGPGKRISDPFKPMRMFLYDLLRLPDEENEFRKSGKVNSRLHNLPLMPLLAGDNPITNELPSKFLRLTERQLFLLKQWADGKFYNDLDRMPDGYNPFRPFPGPAPKTGRALDKGVLGKILGGAFCPGGEVGWIMRNPAIYIEPYRIKPDLQFSTFRMTAARASSLSGAVPPEEYSAYQDQTLSLKNDFDNGLQPGDLTKYMSCPWQADFNECSTQTIDVTYEGWNNIYTQGNSLLADEQMSWETLWWPAHRPMQVQMKLNGNAQPVIVNWASGIQQTAAGDLKMVTDWWRLSFVVDNPDLPATEKYVASPPVDKYIGVEQSYGKGDGK
ncbi:MAG: hypothetical protein HQ483_03810 [Rhodospirillales bacterium]|nr:hypothetical protein [Rhodospirillales bacterium]